MISGFVPISLAGISAGRIALSSCILTAIGVALYVLLTAGLHKHARKSKVFHLVGAVLTVLLLVQSVMFFSIGQMGRMGRSLMESGGENADVLVERVLSLPMPESIRSRLSQGIDNTSGSISTQVDALQKQIRSYRWKRIGWMALFEVAAIFLVWLLMPKDRPAPPPRIVSYDDF